jgi:hypothetical protein|tara:strand:- start:27 stop:140 length:114 start_codon:yes stop_codon:yes gene_type:complete
MTAGLPAAVRIVFMQESERLYGLLAAKDGFAQPQLIR